MSASSAPVLVTLYLMTEKGYRVLRHIVEHLDKSGVALVVSEPDPGLTHDYFDEIKALCAEYGIPFLRRAAPLPVATPYSLAVSWRWLIATESRLVVLHDSLLPRYRGFAPLVSCLTNGEETIGVTALYASPEFDQGDVLLQAARPIRYPIKIAQAIALAIECYLDIVSRLWPGLQTGQPLPATPQQESAASYSLWRDEQDYRIDWAEDSQTIRRFIDAVGEPYRGASTLINGRLHRVLEAEVEPDVVIENRTAGKVLFLRDQAPVVVCGTGLLRLTDLRTEEGSSALPLRQFRSRFT